MAGYLTTKTDKISSCAWTSLRSGNVSAKEPVVVFLGTHPYTQALQSNLPDGWGATALHPLPFEQTFTSSTTEADITIEHWCDGFEAALLDMSPKQPVILVGYSFMGYVAFELAHRSLKAGIDVRGLALLDSLMSGSRNSRINQLLVRLRRGQFKPISKDLVRLTLKRVNSFRNHIFSQERESPIELSSTYLQQAISRLRAVDKHDRWLVAGEECRLIRLHAHKNYKPIPINLPAILFRTNLQEPFKIKSENRSLGWKHFFKVPIRVVGIPGSHVEMVVFKYLEQWKYTFTSELLKTFVSNHEPIRTP